MTTPAVLKTIPLLYPRAPEKSIKELALGLLAEA
jgi:hypothetical protein